LYNILIEFRVPKKLVRLVKMCLTETYVVCPKSKCTDFLCTKWQCSTSLMYIGTLVLTLAACPYLFQLDWLSQSCAIAVVFSNLVTFAMQEIIEQRYASKFCVKLNKSATETFSSLAEAYGDATLSRTMLFKWHKAFKEGRENVQDDPRSGRRPISSTNYQNVEVVRAATAKDRRLSVRMISEETDLN